MLGYAAGPSRQIFALAGEGPVRIIGEAAYAFGVIWALLMAGFSTFWLLIGLGEVVAAFGQSSFSIATWSSSYPIAVYALVWNQLSKDFDSVSFRVVSTGITIIAISACRGVAWPGPADALPVHWLYLAGRTIPLVITGALFLEGLDDTDEAPMERSKASKVRSRDATEARED